MTQCPRPVNVLNPIEKTNNEATAQVTVRETWQNDAGKPVVNQHPSRWKYSWNSHKQVMSGWSLRRGGRSDLRERLPHWHMVTAETYLIFNLKCFIYLWKVNFEKNSVLSIKKFLSEVLPWTKCNNFTTPCYTISTLLSVKWLLIGVENKRKL